jgi:hypothetical protein
MTKSSKKSDKPQSMIEADTANGEAPDTDQDQSTPRPGLDERSVTHPKRRRSDEGVRR